MAFQAALLYSPLFQGLGLRILSTGFLLPGKKSCCAKRFPISLCWTGSVLQAVFCSGFIVIQTRIFLSVFVVCLKNHPRPGWPGSGHHGLPLAVGLRFRLFFRNGYRLILCAGVSCLAGPNGLFRQPAWAGRVWGYLNTQLFRSCLRCRQAAAASLVRLSLDWANVCGNRLRAVQVACMGLDRALGYLNTTFPRP